MKIQNAQKLTATQIKKILADETTSKSHKMKELFNAGHTIKEISAMLDVRYNFAYNVISNYITVYGVEVESTKQASKKDAIIELFKQGKSNKEISAELKANYNYVYNTIKAYKSTLVEETAQ